MRVMRILNVHSTNTWGITIWIRNTISLSITLEYQVQAECTIETRDNQIVEKTTAIYNHDIHKSRTSQK